MSVPEDPFDFVTLLRGEATRNEGTRSGDGGSVAPLPSPQSGGGEPAVVAPLADRLAPNPVPLPPDASLDQRKVAALTTLTSAYKRLTALWPASLSAPDAPLFGIISGGAAFILIAGTVIISLVQHSGGAKLAAMNPQPVKASVVEETTPAGLSHAPAPAPSRDIVEAETRIDGHRNPPENAAVVPASVKTLASAENAPSELPKLATMYSQPPAAQPIPLPPTPPGLSAAQRGAPASRAATETTASLAPGTPPAETKTARTDATPPRGDDASRRKRDQKPAKAVETTIPSVSPTAPQGTPPSRTAAETTASLAPEAPPAETKAARADATLPRADDASRRKRDQKPVPPTAPQGTSPSRATTETTASLAPVAPPAETKTAPRAETAQPHGDDAQNKRDQKTVERSSCSAGMLPGNGGASARAKPVDVQKMCADPRAPFTVSVRCLVAAVVCSDYPTEKPGKVAQKATPTNRATSHPVTDTKPETTPDPKPDTKSH
jgi:hypothetical protein